MTGKTDTKNLHVLEFEPLPSPGEMLNELPLSERATTTVLEGRDDLRRALAGKDGRPVVIVGPCSIHDPKAAVDYAGRLVKLREKLGDRLQIIMRVYFEKPRTTVGWKGLISDPHLDDTYDMGQGLRLARRILSEINEVGMPCATEFLDPIVPQYISDLVSWAAIGARTTESQTHRQMASGLSMPVGFKNATDGGVQVALDALVSAQHPHAFLGIDSEGRTSIVKTSGNHDVHVVLRGGRGRPNFSKADIAYAKVHLENSPHERMLMVDCSHGNSNKDYRKQPQVFHAVLDQIHRGDRAILGMMLESNLVEGRQNLDRKSMVYGQSITDACISWEQTEDLLTEAHAKL